MDEDISRHLTNEFISARTTASVILACVSIGTLLAYSIPIIACITIMSLVVFWLNLHSLKVFTGYGVANTINNVIGSPVIPTFKLTSNRIAPVALIRKWVMRVALYLGIVIGEYLGVYVYHSNGPVQLTPIAGVLMCVVIAEMFVWMQAERLRLWYAHESYVRQYLHRHEMSTAQVENILARLKNEKVLLHGVHFF